jgi:hypothetical protein
MLFSDPPDMAQSASLRTGCTTLHKHRHTHTHTRLHEHLRPPLRHVMACAGYTGRLTRVDDQSTRTSMPLKLRASTAHTTYSQWLRPAARETPHGLAATGLRQARVPWHDALYLNIHPQTPQAPGACPVLAQNATAHVHSRCTRLLCTLLEGTNSRSSMHHGCQEQHHCWW